MISNYSISRIIFYTILTSTILTFGLLRPGIDYNYFTKYSSANSINLLSDFQSELGCTSDFDPSCALTAFTLKNNNWQLMLQVPAGKWNLQINQDGKLYGQHGGENGPYLSLTLARAAGVLFTYNENTHQLSISTGTLESRSQLPPSITLTLTDTLIYDANGNMIANPGDSILYTMILKNQSGQSMANVVITHTGDPNVTFDPNSVKASPLAFNDTITYDTHPKTVIAPGILFNDFDLNDVLPNPPNYTNLTVVKVNSLASNVGVSFMTGGGGTVTVNADGSIMYDSTGVNGALNDIIYYTILDQDGYEDSASILIQFNEPPVISSNLLPTDTICAFEQRDTFIMTPLFTITDDELNEESAKIQICANYLSTEDTLIVGSLPGGITPMWTDGTGTLMLMGSASLADYETAIEDIRYLNQANNPNTSIRTICITVNDGIVNSNQVTRLLKVKPLNDCPTAVRDSISIDENGPIPVYSVLTNDTDPDLDVLFVSKINGSATLDNVVINGGTVSLDDTTGKISFMHTTGFSGLDSLSLGEMFFVRFAYSASDLQCEDEDSVIIKITGINDPPLIASNLLATDTICAFEQQDTFLMTSAFTLLDDETNTDSAKISICLNYNSLEDTLIVPALPPGITFSWNETTGTMMLMGSAPKASYESAIESIQYTNQNNTPSMLTRQICITVHDGDSLSNQVTRLLKVKPVNDCPVAVRDSISILENVSIAGFDVLGNDTDLDFTGLSVSKVNNNAGSVGMSVMISGGTINLNSGGLLNFTHTMGFSGLDSLSAGEMFFARFAYSASDGGCEDEDSVIIKITGVNDKPLIASNLLATDTICAFEQRDTFLMTSVFTLMDDEANTDSAKISICLNYNSSQDTLIVPALPGGITFIWNETTGTMMLMGSAPKASYESAIESIQYTNQSDTPSTLTRQICITVHDGDSLSDQVTRLLKVKTVNDCPIAVRDTFMVNENQSPFPASNVRDNDIDLDMDTISVTPIVNGIINGGTVNLASNGAFTFAHTTGPTGLDTLNVGEMFFARTLYSISDGACSDNDSVIIKITGVNDNPVAGRDSFLGSQTATLTVTAPGLLADDDDIDHNSIIMVGSVNGVMGNVGIQITLASGAKLTVQSNGSFVYIPQLCKAVIDSFQYQVIDEQGALSNTVTVIITLDQSFWFVNDDAPGGGNGSFSSPFNMLSQAESASGPGDYIFVFDGTYTGGITLQNNQKLFGADENWICPVDGSLIRAASGTSNISGGIELAQNDTIKGITAGNNTGVLASITDLGTTVGNLFISNTNLNTSTSSGIRITSGGNLNVTIDTITSTSPNKLIALTNTTGNITVSNGKDTVTAGGGDTLIVIRGGTVSMTFSPSMNQPNNFPLVFIGGGHASGTITFQAGTLSASNGFGLQFNDADGTYNFNGTTTLNGGQSKIDILNGSGGTFSFSSNTSVSNPLGGAAFNIVGGTASVTYSGNITINVVTNPVVSISGHTTGTVTFQSGTLSATIGTGLQFDNADGTYNFNGTATMNGGMAALDILNGSGGAFSFSSGTTITSPTDTAFNLRTGTASVTYSGNITQANNHPLLSISGGHTTGTVTFQTGTLNATNGTGLQFDNADGIYNFNFTTTLNGVNAGIDIFGGSGGAFSFASGTSITNPSGVAFDINNSSVLTNVTYNGTISTNANRPVSIQNVGANSTISFTGNITSTSNGILMATMGNPTSVTFNGASKSLSVGANTAVSYTGATGNTVTFSNGGLAISRTTGAGVIASGGGTLIITRNAGTANTIGNTNSNAAGNGTALSLNGVTIGTGGLVFESISQNGGANGIFLQNTGSTAGLTIAGNSSGNCGGRADTNTGDVRVWSTVAPNAADCTGGTIQNTSGSDNTTSGSGIYLNNTQRVSLTRMNLNDHPNYAIQITSVTGFTADNLYITGTNGTNGTFDEGGIWISNLAGTTAAGTNASITNSTIEGAFEHNVWMVNNTAVLNRITFDNVTVGANANATGDKGIAVEVTGTSATNVTVDNCRFTSARGDMFNLTVQGASGLADLIIDNTEFNNVHGNIVSGGGGVLVNVGESGDLTYSITNNLFRGAKGVGLGVQKLFGGGAGNGTASGTINNNHIGVPGVAGSGSSEGSGIIITILARGTHTSLITNNQVRGYHNYGIYLFVGGSSEGTTGVTHDGVYNVTVQGNSIAEPTNTWTFAQYGIHLRGGTNSGDDYQMCVDIGHDTNAALRNTLDQAGGTVGASTGEDMFIWPRFTTTIRLPNFGGISTDDAGVVTYLKNRNNNSAGTSVLVLRQNTAGWTGGAACTTPLLFAEGGVESLLGLPSAYSLGGESRVNSVSTSLSQSQLDAILAVAVERWLATGLTLKQIAAIREMRFEPTDLADRYLGEASGNRVLVDRDAQGKGWFIDTTPADDFEFGERTSATRSYTNPFASAAGRIDLLTAIEHEIGHRLGLSDLYAENNRDDIMYGSLTVGERRLPAKGQAAKAQAGSLTGTHHLRLKDKVVKGQKPEVRRNHAATTRALVTMSCETVNVTIGTLAAGDSVTITYEVTVNNPPGLSLLNPTGSPVQTLKVSGNGGTCTSAGTCTGGAIQNSTSHGVSLTTTLSPSFTRLAIQNTSGHGVSGTDVTNFTFQNGFIDNSGTGLAPQVSNIGFNTFNANNVDGVVSIINNTLTNSYFHGIAIETYSGTITSLDISGNTITSSTFGGPAFPCMVQTPTTCSQGNAIHVIAHGTAGITSNINDVTVNNIISNFPIGGGIIMQGTNADPASPQLTFGIPNDANNIISITGNRIAGASSANKMNTNAIQVGINGTARGNWEINNNGTVANPITNIAGNVISTSVLGNSTSTVKINNNRIVANHTPNFGGPFGISAGVGKTFAVTDAATLTIVIDGNNVSQTDGNGIKIRGAEAQGTMNVRISNDTIGAPVCTCLREGIFVEAGGSTAGSDNDVCLDMFSNITAGATDGFDTAPGIRLRKQGTVPTTNAFSVEGMAATATPGVEQYVGNFAGGKNPGSANGTYGVNGVVLGSATSGFTNCSVAPLLPESKKFKLK